MKTLFIFGYGATGKAIAKAARGQYKLFSVAKSQATQQQIQADGLTLGIPDAYDYAVITAPPAPSDPFLPLAQPCTALVYLSTTGLYGNHNGAWIDETTPAQPHSERAQKRLEAEEAWVAFGLRHTMPITRFRLSGIYGNTRNALLDMQDGVARRILKDNQVFNRIHEEDIARATLVFLKENYNGIVNGADDFPCPSHEVVSYAASLLNLTPPPFEKFEEANFSEMARSFWAENKRINNGLLKKITGEMTFPSYKEGLKACLTSLPH
jgi:nucleoside-diphosphate-sugar epimerase